MQGFKSFPDKLNIEFHEGITAIVGPNGSGKSNIVDAIRWVLGEQSTKALRGSKMEDVIFGGTLARSQVGFAEVCLNLDNSDGSIPLEYTEVTLTRRYYRSGESEYYINQTQCRLRDIHEMFMNTGLGRDGYSMIGQGKIAEVVSAKSEDRRTIFEEAAGISKFRSRKEESQRKLAATEENLVRICDIHAELESRVEPLAVESARAKEYLECRDERRQLEVDVWLHGIGQVKDHLSKVEADLLAVTAELEKSGKAAEEAEREIDEKFAKIAEINAKIEDIRAEIKSENEIITELRGAYAVAENDIAHAKAKAEDIKKSAEQAAPKSAELAAATEEKSRHITELEAEINRIDSELSALHEKNEKAILSAESENDKGSGLSAKLSAEEAGRTELKILLSAKSAEEEQATARVAVLKADLAAKEPEIARIKAERETAKNRALLQEEETNKLQNMIAGYSAKLAAKEAKRETAQNELDLLTKNLFEKEHRLSVLSDMEKAHDGYFFSVKKILELSNRGRLKGIIGTVSSLVSAKEEYAVAVETALGGAMQHIVTENEEAAKSAIRLLKSENAGRATFLPIDVMKGAAFDEKNIEKEEGFVGIASDLASFDAKYKNIITGICGRAAVAENIDAAVRIAKKYSNRFKVVTLDGQIVNIGGSLTGGSQQKNVGLLSRKNEIEKLKAEVSGLKNKENSLKEAHKKCVLDADEANAELVGANAELQTAREEKLRLEGELNRISDLSAAIEAGAAAYIAEEKQLAEKIKQIADLKKEISGKIEISEKAAKEIENEIAKISGVLSLAIAEKEKTAEEISEKRLRIAELHRDIEADKQAAEEIRLRMESFCLEQAEKESEVKKCEAEAAALLLKAEGIKAEIAQKEERAEKSAENIKELSKERDDAEKDITKLRQEAKEKSGGRENLIKEESRLEARKASISGEYDNVVAKLWDEYELTVSEAEKIRRPVTELSKTNKRISELKSKMKSLGDVNIGAIEEYKTVKERYEFLSAQISDLESSKGELIKIIDDLTEIMKTLFKEQFSVINAKFSEVFRDLFGGGSACLELTDQSNILDSGIEIKVSPPGKLIKTLALLSGGEQALVAIALYFAIFAIKPVPFCILDEIEAALDDVNVTRFANYVRKFSKKTQFIIVTHRRGTMESAERLYGVTMQEKGISKLLALNVAEIEERLKIKI